MVAVRVEPEQRFTRDRPCPICGGHKDLPAGKGQRCYGFLSTDGAYAHCTREDRAGTIRPDPNGQTYAHRLHGECHCGQTHGEPTGPTFRFSSNGAGKPRSREVARYSYTNEAGDELYHVRRFDPKDFRPYLPGADIPGLPASVRRVLYDLPELMQADDGEYIFAPEGEKDADNLRAEHLLATTSQGGAGQCRQWLDPVFVAPLKGQNVVILPHNDPDGERFAATVTQGLAGIAASVRVLHLPNLPPKGDVSDWLAAGNTVDELIMLAHAVAPETPGEPATSEPDAEPSSRWVDLATVLAGRPPAWLVDDILPGKATAVLGGKWGSFKSFLALDLALCVATGTPWGGKPVRQGPAAYIVAEGYGGLGPRVRAWLTVHQLAPDAIPIRFLPAAPNFQDSDAVGEVLTEIAAFPAPPALIVVDTLARTNIGAEENSAKDMGAYFDACQQLQQATGATVLVLHHPTKNGDSLRGSGAILGAADTILSVERQGDKVKFSCQKQKDAAEFEPLHFARHIVDLGGDESSIVLQPYEPIRVTSEPATKAEEQAYAALLKLGKRATFTEWLKASGLANSSFSRAVNGLEAGGLVRKVDHGRYEKSTPTADPGVGVEMGVNDAGGVGAEWE